MVNGAVAAKNIDKLFKKIRKRDGKLVAFDVGRIMTVVKKAMDATGDGSAIDANRVAEKVVLHLYKEHLKDKSYVPAVEEVQDAVERELIWEDFAETAKAYILYREEHARQRAERGEVPADVKKKVKESEKYFKDNPLGEFIYLRTYSRWIEDEDRRETWIETVDRYMSFMKENLGKKLSPKEYDEVRDAILNHEAMPSMRLLQFAGSAARRCNVCSYNCSFISPTKLKDFAEIMYISMSGAGAGYSCESRFVERLPQIKMQTGGKPKKYKIADSTAGWCDALTLGLQTWYAGKDVDFDYSGIRPAGARLKTKGGKASGPEPLRNLLQFVREKVIARQGKRLRTIDVHDIICKIGENVVAGGVRRSALISLSDLDDDDVRHAKDGQFYLTEPQRSLANNSAVYEQKPSVEDFMDEWFALVKGKSGERGIFNRGGLAISLPERRINFFKKKKYVAGGRVVGPIGTNPCVTGDTLVYTADGRGNVPIKQLAKEGKDVPVFCLNSRGGLSVRTMRNPRLTGKSEQIYRVTFHDGSQVHVTGNHKFRLKSGEYKEAQSLQHGDSLHVLTRYEASIKDIFPGANSRSQDYWWINNGKGTNVGEHRPIAEFHYNTRVPKGHVVHHKDRNAQNNAPENLEIMSKKTHDALHAELMKGDNNPMRRAYTEWSREQWEAYKAIHSKNNAGENNKRYSGTTDEKLREHALILTKKRGYRFSNSEWMEYAKENNLPQSFSKWRRNHLGNVSGLAKWAALECGFEHVDADPRVVKSYKFYTAQGYDCEIQDGAVVIHKTCEVCEEAFVAPLARREYGVCGQTCGLKKAWANDATRERLHTALVDAHVKRKAHTREEQGRAYSDLAFELGRAPLKDEWREACRKEGISVEISRTSSPFRSFADLGEYAESYNHKVVSAEPAGKRNVYNGTVDEFHNFFVGGFQATTRSGKQKMFYLNNLQCGEILLQSKEFCNLTEVVCRQKDTLEDLKRKVRAATILGTYQATLTDFKYLSKQWKKNCEDEALLGVSLTGQWDCPEVRKDETLRKLLAESIKANKKYAKKLGINESTCITTTKPSGNLSQTVNCSSGMHPRYAPYYIRRVRIASTDALFKLLRDQGVPHHPEVGQTLETATTYVVDFPVKAPSNAKVFSNDLSAIEQLEYWKKVKLNYTEHNPSQTIHVGPDEWLSVANWLYDNWDIVGGLSFLPRTDHVYRLAPYEEITKERYEELKKKYENVDFSKIVIYEKEDETNVKAELACAGGTCEI